MRYFSQEMHYSRAHKRDKLTKCQKKSFVLAFAAMKKKEYLCHSQINPLTTLNNTFIYYNF